MDSLIMGQQLEFSWIKLEKFRTFLISADCHILCIINLSTSYCFLSIKFIKSCWISVIMQRWWDFWSFIKCLPNTANSVISPMQFDESPILQLSLTLVLVPWPSLDICLHLAFSRGWRSTMICKTENIVVSVDFYKL